MHMNRKCFITGPSCQIYPGAVVLRNGLEGSYSERAIVVLLHVNQDVSMLWQRFCIDIGYCLRLYWGWVRMSFNHAISQGDTSWGNRVILHVLANLSFVYTTSWG